MDVCGKMIEKLFVACLVFLVYIYGLYPLIITILARNINFKLEKSFTPSVSIVIPAYNEERSIESKINNTLRLDYPIEKLEILVVDDGSVDKTEKICRKFLKKNIINLTYLRLSERNGKAHALNVALANCSNDIFIVSDSNAILERGSIKKIARWFELSDVGGVNGNIKPIRADTLIGMGAASYYNIDHIIRLSESRVDSIINLIGKLSAYRRTALEKIGGFNESAVTEDMESTVRLRKAGWRILYDPEAVVYEPTILTIRDYFVQKVRRTVGTIQCVFEHKDVILNPKLGMFGLLIYPSHKVLPLLNPFIYFGVLVYMVKVFFNQGPIIALGIFIFTIFIVFLSSMIPSYLCPKILKLNLKKKRKGYYWLIASGIALLLMQIVIFISWLEYISGKYSVKWEKAQTGRG